VKNESTIVQNNSNNGSLSRTTQWEMCVQKDENSQQMI